MFRAGNTATDIEQGKRTNPLIGRAEELPDEESSGGPVELDVVDDERRGVSTHTAMMVGLAVLVVMFVIYELLTWQPLGGSP